MTIDRMPSLTSFLRALGNERAVANASALLDARRRDDWLVAGLARRLDRHEGTSQTAPGVDSGVPARTAL